MAIEQEVLLFKACGKSAHDRKSVVQQTTYLIVGMITKKRPRLYLPFGVHTREIISSPPVDSIS